MATESCPLLRRLYRLAVGCSPADIRDRYGAEMEEAFAGLVRRRLESGGRAVAVLFALRAMADTARAGLRERIRRRRERRHGSMMVDLLTDLRLSMRGLAMRPALSIVLVGTLALGIGASTAVFTVLRGVLLAPLPYPEPEALVSVSHVAASVSEAVPQGMGGEDLLDYMAGAPSIEAFGGIQTLESNLNDAEGASRVVMGWATPAFFEVIGVEAALGRVLRPEDWVGAARSTMEDPDFTPPVMAVLMSYGLWQAGFGADPTIVGRTLRLNGQAMEVIGVLPDRFALHLPAWAQVPTSIDVFALMPVPLTDMGRGVGGLNVVARLADGVTIERARSEMETVAGELRSTYATHSESDTRVRVEPLHDEVVGTARPLLWILFGAVGLLLFIAAMNVANLILVRAASREREFAVRAALGVSRSRVARQLLAEGLIVSALGAAVGTALAGLLVRILIAARPAELPRLESSSVDGSVLLFTGGVSIVVALVFGLAPMITSRGATAAGLLRDRGTGAGARAGVRLRRVLVAAELAVSVVLLAGAGLLLRSFAELQRVDPGVDATGVVALDVAVPFFEYRDDDVRAAFFVELSRRADELQGVTAAGVTARLPLEPGTGGTWFAAWGPDGAVLDGQNSPHAQYRPLAPGALTALGVRFREGRDFESRDEIPGTAVPVIVDVRIADQFPQGAIGRRLRLSIAAYTGLDREVEATIVGVTEPAHFGTLAEVDQPTLFVPYRMFAPVDGTLVVRTTNSPERTAEQVRALVAEIDAGIPVFAARRFADVVRTATAEARYSLFLVATFAVLALILAAVGLYGVVSTLAQQRTREISLRIALGAHGRDIARLVVREGTIVTLPGLALGLMGAAVVTPLGRSLLFEVQPLDPIALAGTVVLLMTVAWLATVIPARRATRVDPARALREE